MRFVARLGLLCVPLSLALLVANAAAAPKPITGKLSKPGYTVIALAANSKAKAVRASRGKFRLRPPALSVSLHLRAPNGKYAGPIVVGRAGRRVVVGLKAGARLGRVSVRSGYARVTRRLPKRWVDARRTARARRGVPLGAREFGHVRSRPPRRPVRRDTDLDGVPDLLDIDDDGDLILDNLDHSRAARAAQKKGELGFELELPGAALNANAGDVTGEQIDAHLSSSGAFTSFIFPRGDSVELDCGQPQRRTDPLLGGLVYCTKGGTGRLFGFGEPPPLRGRFPDDFDPDHDGFGTLSGPGKASGDSMLRHGATSSQIGTGDVLIARVTRSGAETQVAATLQYVPVTTPALVSYSDGQGNSRTVSYPIPEPPPGGVCPPPGPCSGPGPGTQGNPFPVKGRANGDVVLTFTLWRPQRARLANDPAPQEGDSALWTDIGGLFYGADAGPPGKECWPSDFSENDPNVVVDPGGEPGGEEFGAIRDDALSTPANPRNTLTYTLNLTKCLGRVEMDSPAGTWNPGETKEVSFGSTDRSGASARPGGFSFRRVG